MRIKLCMFFSFLFCLIGCKAQESIREKRVLTETIILIDSYFDSIVKNNGRKVQNQIIHKVGQKTWIDSLIPSKLWAIRNFNIKEKADIIDFEALFNEADIHSFRSTSQKFKIENWSEIISHSIIVDSTRKGLLLSSPAFDKSFKHAIFYLEDSSSGSLILFKKVNEQWTYFGSGMIWID